MIAQSLVHEVTLTEARDLSPLYTEAVREDRPVIIHRRGDEDGVLARLDFLRELLMPYIFHVHYYEEDAEDDREGAGGGGYTLEIEELNIAAYGAMVPEARFAAREYALLRPTLPRLVGEVPALPGQGSDAFLYLASRPRA